MAFPIRAVAFDIGRVLIDFEHFVFCQNIVPHCNGLNATQIYQRIFGCIKAINWWHNYEKGNIDTVSFVESIRKKLNMYDSFRLEELIQITMTSFFLNEGILKILDDLIEIKIPIFMISNISELHWFTLQRKFPELISRFPKLNRLLSFEIGVRKPDSMIYLDMLQRLGFQHGFSSRGLEDILFIDDGKENVREFERMSGQTIQYSCRKTNIKFLAKRISAFKIWP